jgi:hypothetical protein
MGNDEALNDVILRSRDDLQRAIDISVNSPRSPHVCDSHDSLFGLVQANARASVTILTVLSRKSSFTVNDANQFVSDGFVPKFVLIAKTLRPYAWPTALLCFSPNAVGIVRAVMDHFSK